MKNFIISLLLLAPQCMYTAQSRILNILPAAARMVSLRKAVASVEKVGPLFDRGFENALINNIGNCQKNLLRIEENIHNIQSSVDHIRSKANTDIVLRDLEYTKYNLYYNKMHCDVVIEQTNNTRDLLDSSEKEAKSKLDKLTLIRMSIESRLASMKKTNGPQGLALHEIDVNASSAIKKLNQALINFRFIRYQVDALEYKITTDLLTKNALKHDLIEEDLKKIEATLNERIALYEENLKKQAILKTTAEQKQTNKTELSSLIGYWLGQKS